MFLCISQLLFKSISLFFSIKFTTFILKKYLTNDFGFWEMLTDILRAFVNELFQESFYEKKKKLGFDLLPVLF